MDYTITVSQPGYMPISTYVLRDYEPAYAAEVFQDELYRTAESEGLPYFDIPTLEDFKDQIANWGEIAFYFGGYVHELTPTPN